MFCEHCGTKLDGSSQFCHNCGKSISNTPAQAVAATMPAEIAATTIKCAECGYVGHPQYARTTIGVILAWLCIFIGPLITLIYFAVTHKYRCPKCQSTAIAIKNEGGEFKGQKSGGAASRVLTIIVVIAVIGILASVVLVSLNSAREKGREALQQQNASLNQ